PSVGPAYERGAYSFHTGRTMYTGSAVKAWRHLELPEARYEEFFAVLREKAIEYRGRMRVYFHEAGLLEELRYRLKHPAALLIMLPNGLVKLINALPFICGDLRREPLHHGLARVPRAGGGPRVGQVVAGLAGAPGLTRTLRPRIYLFRRGPRTGCRHRARCRAGCSRSAAWSAIDFSSMRASCRISSARPGPTPSPARSTFPPSGVASPASCSPSSASRRSTSTSIRGWARTA